METPPTCCCHEFWTTHHPECPTLRPSSKTSTDTEVEAALAWLLRAVDRPHAAVWLQRGVRGSVDTIRAYIAAQQEELKELDDYAEEVAIGGLKAEAVAKLDGWREAAEWLRDVVHATIGDEAAQDAYEELMAQADRREGK